MQYLSITALVALLATATAVPTPGAAEMDMMAASGKWTVQKFSRTCDSKDTSCKFSYDISTGSGKPQSCTYTVQAKSEASRAKYSNIHCGSFTISSNWSGQFGSGKGFQTLAMVKGKQIIYPAYIDKDLANGKTVKPDRSYTPQNLP